DPVGVAAGAAGVDEAVQALDVAAPVVQDGSRDARFVEADVVYPVGPPFGVVLGEVGTRQPVHRVVVEGIPGDRVGVRPAIVIAVLDPGVHVALGAPRGPGDVTVSLRGSSEGGACEVVVAQS